MRPMAVIASKALLWKTEMSAPLYRLVGRKSPLAEGEGFGFAVDAHDVARKQIASSRSPSPSSPSLSSGARRLISSTPVSSSSSSHLVPVLAALSALSEGMDMFEDMDNNEKGPGKNKRKWTDAEDKELVYALFDMVNAGTHKADNGFKPGFLGVIEAVLKEKLPGSGIKAKPHIDSRIKTMKKDFRVVYDMLNGENCSGFGWDPHKNVVVAEDEVWNAYVKTHKGAGQWRSRSFPYYEMLCTIFGKDRATGKGAATTEDVLDELTRTEENEDTQNVGMDFVEMEHYTSTASTNNEGTSKKGKRRRSTDNMDGFREAAMIIANKIDEATEKFSRAIGVDLDIANKRDKINEELRKLPNLSRAERHKALIVIGRDHEMTAVFFTLENDEKEDFVRALLSGGL